jgi:hypothetical protein
MADFTPQNVRVAQGGRLQFADPADNPTVPALWSPTTSWGTPWRSLGLFNEDAVEHTFSDETEEIVSWQRGVVRIVVTGRELTLALSALETSADVLEMFYGAAFVGVGSAGSYTAGRMEISHNAVRKPVTLGFEWYDGSNGATWRLEVPNATVAETENPTFTNSGAVEWGMTLRALGTEADYLAAWTTNDPGVLAALNGGAGGGNP